MQEREKVNREAATKYPVQGGLGTEAQLGYRLGAKCHAKLFFVQVIISNPQINRRVNKHIDVTARLWIEKQSATLRKINASLK